MTTLGCTQASKGASFRAGWGIWAVRRSLLEESPARSAEISPASPPGGEVDATCQQC